MTERRTDDPQKPRVQLHVIDCRPDLYERLRQSRSFRRRRAWLLPALLACAGIVCAALLALR